jgi:hypothetical protein
MSKNKNKSEHHSHHGQSDGNGRGEKVTFMVTHDKYGVVECSYYPEQFLQYLFDLFADLLSRDGYIDADRYPLGGSSGIQKVRIFNPIAVMELEEYAAKIIPIHIRQVIDQALISFASEVKARTLLEMEGNTHKLGSSNSHKRMVNKILKASNRDLRKRMNTPSPGRPSEFVLRLGEIRQAAEALRLKGEKVTQSKVAERMGVSERYLRKLLKDRGVRWAAAKNGTN